MGKLTTYEYAGFLFDIVDSGDGVKAVAQEGQHKAAHKNRHAVAALECWINDGKPIPPDPTRTARGNKGK